MNVDEQQLRLTLNHLFTSKRGNEIYPALLEMLDRTELRFWVCSRMVKWSSQPI